MLCVKDSYTLLIQIRAVLQKLTKTKSFHL